MDTTVILQKPILAEFIPQMKYNLAYSLQIDESLVSLKATTADYLGFIGEGKGWAAQAVATLYSTSGSSQS